MDGAEPKASSKWKVTRSVIQLDGAKVVGQNSVTASRGEEREKSEEGSVEQMNGAKVVG